MQNVADTVPELVEAKIRLQHEASSPFSVTAAPLPNFWAPCTLFHYKVLLGQQLSALPSSGVAVVTSVIAEPNINELSQVE